MSHSTMLHNLPIKDRKALNTTIAELQKAGVRCELLTNAAPRMFYKDQLHRHYGLSTEVCPLVLRLHDSPYDIGFIQEGNELFPVFDAYRCPARPAGCKISTKDGLYGISDVLGHPWDGNESHWAGLRRVDGTELTREDIELMHVPAKFTRLYARHAAVNLVRAHKHTIKRIEQSETGKVRIYY